MAESAPKMEFQFVNSTVSSPTVPKDNAVRVLIRKQAMKKASLARKRDGNYGKHNLRQYPVFVYDQENTVIEQTVEVKDERNSVSPPRLLAEPVEVKEVRSMGDKKQRAAVEKQRWLAKLSLVENMSHGMSAKGYELTSIKNDFDILGLSTLSTLHVGRFTRAALSQNPDHLVYQLRAKYDPQNSYLSFLPSRYDQVGVLSDATDCVIARARFIVSPNKNWETAVLSFYGKALDSLQKALDCPKQRYKAETLCAIEILALYELLNPSGESGAWIRHTAGASQVIHLRGPKSYRTEFEKALFMAHTVPIVTECLFNGERCFLEQKAWQKVFISCIQDTPTLTDRSEIVMSLLMLKCFIPGQFADVTNIICRSGQPYTPDVSSTAQLIRKLHKDLIDWYRRYEFSQKFKPKILPGSPAYDSHAKVFATYLCCIIITSRLLSAISPSERIGLETSALVHAEQMFRLEEEAKDVSMQTTLFLAQTIGVSHSIKFTTNDWIVTTPGFDPTELDDSNGIIARWKFEGWNNICGRKLPGQV